MPIFDILKKDRNDESVWDYGFFIYLSFIDTFAKIARKTLRGDEKIAWREAKQMKELE